MVDLAEVEVRLGLAFRDKSLLHRALVHRSYHNEHPGFPLEDNERLEFLGDAVLGFVTGEWLYHRFPEMTEGQLTDLRSALVRRDALAQLARQLDLGHFLLMGAGEITTGGRNRPATLCASFEALIGALYLDQGIEAVLRYLEPLMGPAAVRVVQEQSDRDSKSRLQELSQGTMRETPRYRTVSESGPDHARQFTVEVTIAGMPYGLGTGLNKQQAAQAAAHQALIRLDREGTHHPHPAAEPDVPDCGEPPNR
jgi:ribonuclease III